MPLFGVFGVGGFGREVMPVAVECLALSSGDRASELVFVADVPDNAMVNGYPVMDTASFLADARSKRFNIAVADSSARERIAARLIASGAVPFEVRSRQHLSMDHNMVGDGAVLCPFTTITSNARIGRFFHLNIYSYVAHDCVIGNFVTFAPAVRCNGRVVIEDHAYVGTGAIIRQGADDRPIVIGRGAVIGMGAVVTRSVSAGETVVGNPAAALRKLANT